VLILNVIDLKTYFYSNLGVVRAVDGLSFSIKPEEIIGIVGESGCGKSLTALSILRLIPQPGRTVSGQIFYYYKGAMVDILNLKPKGKELRSIRGGEIAMIFQDPMTAFDPVHSIGSQIMEAIILHQNLSKKEARKMGIEMLHKVGIPLPKHRFDEYPHQFSGGMLQRAMIAMALSCNPAILIADEPTTALDVTIQAQILDLLTDLRADFKTAIILISHDLGVIAKLADEVIVMYVGKAVEKSDVSTIFHNPKHPYTIALMDSVPSITETSKRFKTIKGVVPNALKLPLGCYFEPRCPAANKKCRTERPSLIEVERDHWVACWLY